MKDNKTVYEDILQTPNLLGDVSLDFIKNLANKYPLHQPLQALLIKKIMLLDEGNSAELRSSVHLQLPFVDYVYEKSISQVKLPTLPPIGFNAPEKLSEEIPELAEEPNEAKIDEEEPEILELVKPESEQFKLVEDEESFDLLEEDDLGVEDETVDDLEEEDDLGIEDETVDDLEEEDDLGIEDETVDDLEEVINVENEEIPFEKDEIRLVDGESAKSEPEISSPKEGKYYNNRLEKLAELSFLIKPKADFEINKTNEESINKVSTENKEKEDKLEAIRKMLFDEDDKEQTQEVEENVLEPEDLQNNDIQTTVEDEVSKLSLEKRIIYEFDTETNSIKDNVEVKDETTYQEQEIEIDDNVIEKVNDDLAKIQCQPQDSIDDSVDEINEILKDEVLKDLEEQAKLLDTPNTLKALASFDSLMEVVKQKFEDKNQLDADTDSENKEIEDRVSKGESLQNGVHSEAMARFLEKKGKILDAIEVFQSLKLKFPEKSNYFATEIKRLNSKL